MKLFSQNTTDSASKAKTLPAISSDTSQRDSTMTKWINTMFATPQSKDMFWGSYGYGLVLYAGGLSANYAHKKHLLTLRYGGSFSDFNRTYD